MTQAEWLDQYILDNVGSTITLDDFPITVSPPKEVSPTDITITKDDALKILDSYSATLGM